MFHRIREHERDIRSVSRPNDRLKPELEQVGISETEGTCLDGIQG